MIYLPFLTKMALLDHYHLRMSDTTLDLCDEMLLHFPSPYLMYVKLAFSLLSCLLQGSRNYTMLSGSGPFLPN